jgi:hypothetical protein
MEERIKKLEKEVEEIKKRNLRVEGDKAWETSYFRVFLISVIIYVLAVKILQFMGSKDFLINALFPPIGYFISDQSLPFIKKWWIKNREKIN